MPDNILHAEQINDAAFELFVKAIHSPKEFDIRVIDVGDTKVLDFAVERKGTEEAGVILAEICMGSLAKVELLTPFGDLNRPQVKVETSMPLESCIGSQYAGWPVSHEKFFAMCSGPMRMPRGKEDVLNEYKLHQPATVAVGVMEANKIPDAEVIDLIAQQCGVKSRDVNLCIARTASYPGSIQVVARSVETAMHKLHELKFDLSTIVHGEGTAPVPPIADDDMTALGWTNDSMLYGAKVTLTVDTEDDEIEAILDDIPSSSSSEFGTPFLDIFNRYDKDFYKIDKMLFSPAEIVIKNQKTDREFTAGEVRNDILKTSFGIS